MSILQSAEYRTSAYTKSTHGQRDVLQMDKNGGLYVHSRPNLLEDFNYVAGALSTSGKIGTIANAATLYIILDCTEKPVERVDWLVSIDQAWEYQLARAHSNPLSATITLADATAVDDGDTFVLNGLTFTAEATQSDAIASDRKFWTGANNAACAANLAALLTHATYGVPGITASVAPVAATDVITITPSATSGATCLQFGQGTSDANEIAWADGTKANLWAQGGVVAGKAANNTWKGESIEQWVDGWEWPCIAITNKSGAAAATAQVRVVRY
jgi:hypothetical protein